MREFKTGNLNTEQVVSRVSLLFSQHQNLMEGFHNFLPQGGRTQANGVHQHLNGISSPNLMNGTTIGSGSSDIATRISTSIPQLSPTPQPRNHTGVAHPSHISMPTQVSQDLMAPTQSAAPLVTPGAASVLNAGANGSKGAVEFNHAINYVNKIKTRYAHDARTYKEFLEILQTYQKDSKPIQEVYHSVTLLFADAPDLLAEFKQFLPDNSAPPASVPSLQPASIPPAQGAKPATTSKHDTPTTTERRRQGVSTKRQRDEDDASAILPPPPPKKRIRGTGAANAHAKAKEKEKEEEAAPPPPSKRARNARTSTKATARPASPPPVLEEAFNPPILDAPYVSAIQQPELTAVQRLDALQSLQHQASIPRHLAPVPIHDVTFFDELKKAWDNKARYQSFLRLLGLYNAKIIKLDDLMDRAYEFLGDSELHIETFKEIVGWDVERRDSGGGRIEGEEWYIENEDALERKRVDLSTRPRCGISYRKLPSWEVDLVCTGRDGGDWSVLNDEWVAFPPANTGTEMPRGESSSHKARGASEEIIFHIEHERHIFSITIETNSRAMAYLRPLLIKIQRMSQAEKDVFKLPEDLGIPSPSIVKRNLVKIYGASATPEIFKSLSEQPAITIPVIMARFQAKDEEWRKLQKDYSKVWRDMERQHHYKALDPKGITIKKEDMKALKPACLTYEISMLKKKKEKRRFDVEKSSPPTRPNAQLEFGMKKGIMLDTAHLLSFYVRQTNTITKTDKLKMQKYLRRILLAFFQLDQDELDARVPPPEEEDEASEEPSMDKDEEDSSTEQPEQPSRLSESTTTIQPPARIQELGEKSPKKKEKNGDDDDDSALSSLSPESRAASEPVASAPTVDASVSMDVDDNGKVTGKDSATAKIDLLSWDGTSWDARYERRWNMFGDPHFYQFFRMFQVLYHRLAAMNWVCTQKLMQKVPRLSSLAVELAFATKVEGIDDGYEQYYSHMLELCRRHMMGTVDTGYFEECLRWMFGIRAFPIFSVVIICQAAIKVLQSLDDHTSIELLQLLERDRSQPMSTLKEQVRYRVEAEELLEGNSKLYRIEWHPKAEIVTMEILDKKTNAQGSKDLARYMRDESAPFNGTINTTNPTSAG
ncbi:hypothetical protein BT69DRAFT_1245805 [Atractiella rhizophila]|nr:hypothetical protein BT69DRAFT_1245805 [Atractiella rhizophila]